MFAIYKQFGEKFRVVFGKKFTGVTEVLTHHEEPQSVQFLSCNLIS